MDQGNWNVRMETPMRDPGNKDYVSEKELISGRMVLFTKGVG
jgi:hypothetical protein